MSFEQYFKTDGGVEIAATRCDLPFNSALHQLLPQLNTQKGILLSSGFDYPGRHSRWDIGFVNPALEFQSWGREFLVRALNEQGRYLLPIVAEALSQHEHVESSSSSTSEFSGTVLPFPAYFIEEQRSRQPSVFSVLRALVELFRSKDPSLAHLGLYGAFGYDLVMQFEDIRPKHIRTRAQADCHLYLPLDVVVVDRKKEQAFSVAYSIKTPSGFTHNVPAGGESFPLPQERPDEGHVVSCDHSAGAFAEKVEQVIEGTKRGDYFEVVLSQEFSCPYSGLASTLFERLSKVNPSPYMFLVNLGEEQLIGASPEIYARVTDGLYETCPIAGTVRRGENALEDADRVKELISSEKDESELTMCTDVDRNDMARVCVPGTVTVVGRRQLEFYSHLIHTVDHLTGVLKPEFDALDAFQTHMWACTVTGSPKPAALQTIEDLEESPRGWYSGAVGMLSFQGNLNTGILLRTASVKKGTATIRAGATLLYDSDPIMEERETRTKAAAFLAALASAKSAPEVVQKKIKKAPRERRVLLVDCRDSFIHMLASYLRELGAHVTTVRSGFPLEKLAELKPELVLLSPGPGTPTEFGVPTLVGELISRQIPMFGVCLGHQGIGQYFGATLGQLPTPVHGKQHLITHTASPLFTDVPPEFTVGRYHSLYLVHSTLPAELRCTASCVRIDDDGKEEIIPMAVEHSSLPIAGVQFHPESLMTLKQEAGYSILRNALSTLIS